MIYEKTLATIYAIKLFSWVTAFIHEKILYIQKNKLNLSFLETLATITKSTRIAWPILIWSRAFQCNSMGWCIKWESLLTTKAISSFVSVRYWRAPTIFQYLIVSVWGDPSTKVRELLVAIGVTIPLAPSFVAWSIMSLL